MQSLSDQGESIPDFFNSESAPLPPQSSIRDVITGLLRVSAAAMIMCVVTGLQETGIVIAVIGTVWLYCRL